MTKFLKPFKGIALLIISAVFIITPSFGRQKNKSQAPPNILIITVDNVGYGDFSFMNEASPILTPNLNKLAKQGAILTDFYTGSPTCTASRASLLTGRIPQRNKLDYQLGGLAGNYGIGLPQTEIIIPRVLKNSAHGYATGAFGKWNIGFAPGSRPTERGFDEFLGIASGNVDHFSHVYAGRHDLYHNTTSINRHGEFSTDLFANAAIDFINKNTAEEKPWMVYLPFDAPHHPGDRNIAPGEENIWKAPDYAFKPYGLKPDEKDPKKRFNAIVTAIDMAVGRLMNYLDELGIADNTFVFFYSDNGAFYPYLDIQSNDGKNPLPVLTGETTHSPHASLFFKYKGQEALIWGDYKILRESNLDPWKLFNLSEDISESNDLAEKRPDLVEKLAQPFKLTEEEIKSDLEREKRNAMLLQ